MATIINALVITSKIVTQLRNCIAACRSHPLKSSWWQFLLFHRIICYGHCAGSNVIVRWQKWKVGLYSGSQPEWDTCDQVLIQTFHQLQNTSKVCMSSFPSHSWLENLPFTCTLISCPAMIVFAGCQLSSRGIKLQGYQVFLLVEGLFIWPHMLPSVNYVIIVSTSVLLDINYF